MILLAALACSGPTLNAGGPILDVHTHCPTELSVCDVSSLEASRDGTITAAVLGLSHYAIAETLGDPLPAEVAQLAQNNQVVAELVQTTDHALLVPSLDCLATVPGDDPDFASRCLADADRWLEAGALGFKDHAGKTFDGEIDLARWVGAYNRLAGWCEVDADSASPNLDCLAQPTLRMPLSVPAWREMIRGLVEDREVPVLSHATPWDGSTTLCGTPQGPENCHDLAADALVDFAQWAEQELSPEARRRFVVLHLGFLTDDEVRLRAILDAGLSVDIAQTSLTQAGCGLRQLVAEYPDQVLFGTDLFHGLACTPQHYDAWMFALIGPADTSRTYRNTCRDTLNPVGAGLATADAGACGIALDPQASRKVLYGNAARLFGID